MATNEITKYGNELNTIPLGHLTSTEMNIFFSIITKMKDKGQERVELTFEELRNLSDYTTRSNKRFGEAMFKLHKKLLQLNFGTTSKSGLVKEQFVMFSEFKIDEEVSDPYVSIKVYKKAVPLLNELSTWVRYSLSEFNNLNNKYAKTLFRLLKQYRTTGKAIMPIDKFRELMAVPKSYRVTNIDSSIIKPAMKEISPYFKGLKVKKEKYEKKRGKPLKNYTFTFTPEPKNSDDFQEKKKTYKKSTQSKETATDWSKKQSKTKVDNRSLNDILGQINEVKEEVKS